MFNIKYGQSPLLFLNFIIFFYSLGVYMTTNLNMSYTHLFCLIIVNIILAIIATQRKASITYILFFSLFLFLGIFRTLIAYNIPLNNIANFENQTITIKGTICQTPKIRQDTTGIYHLTYIVDINTITVNQQNCIGNGKIYLYQKSSTLPQIAQANDLITATGTVHHITTFHNPGLINNTLSAQNQGIYASINLGSQNLTIIKPFTNFSLQRYCDQIRQSILDKFLLAMPANDAHLLFAMLFGGYNQIDDSLLTAYSTTGLIHILSVSGSHITLLIMFLLYFMKRLRLPSIVSFFTICLFLGMYAILCGANAPVLRATLMGLLYLLSLYLYESSTAKHLLSVIALCLLIYNPLYLFDISFQLSFVSTAGLLYLMPTLQKQLNFLPSIICDSFSLTLSAQIFTLPFISWYFNSFSLASFLANLIIIPPLESIIILGLIASLLAFCLPFVAHILCIFASLLLKSSNFLTLSLAKLPLSSIYIPSFNYIDSLFFYTLIYLLIKKPTFHFLSLKKPLYYVLILCVCFSFYKVVEFKTLQTLQLHFIDVGQGDSCLIITPNKHSILIDTGGAINSDFDIGSRVTLPYLHHYGITKLDYLIFSHSDADHCKGGASMLEQIPIKHLILSDEDLCLYTKNLQPSANSLLWKKAIIAQKDMQISVDGITLTFLQDLQTMYNTSNDHSNVIKLTYHDFSTLFTGDISQTVEQTLLSKDICATVLKVAHHGSKTSSHTDFINKVRPQLSIISVGKYNSFQHPHDEVLTRLNDISSKILRTDQNGAIIISTDGYTFNYESFIK